MQYLNEPSAIKKINKPYLKENLKISISMRKEKKLKKYFFFSLFNNILICYTHRHI